MKSPRFSASKNLDALFESVKKISSSVAVMKFSPASKLSSASAWWLSARVVDELHTALKLMPASKIPRQ